MRRRLCCLRRLTVVCFGAMRDYLPRAPTAGPGRDRGPRGPTVGDVAEALGRAPRLLPSPWSTASRRDIDELVTDGCEVTLMPPFAGGRPEGATWPRPRTTRKTTAESTTEPAKSSQPRPNGTLKSFNPRTGEVIAEIQPTHPEEVAEIVDHARKVAPEWAAIAPEGRAHILSEVRYRIYELTDEIVETVSAENGKPRAEALAHDVVPTADDARLLRAHRRRRLLRPRSRARSWAARSASASRIEWRPYGVVGCITPWNYPFTNTFLSFTRPCSPATPWSSSHRRSPRVRRAVRKVLEPLPPGVATVIQGGGDVGAALVDAPCDKISFIGSPPTGRKICEAAAKHLTPVVMELGGKDAAIVLDDADLDVATSGVLWGAFLNAGQTCCSIERAYVVDNVADEFKDQLAAKLAKLVRQADGELGAHHLRASARHRVDARSTTRSRRARRFSRGAPTTGRANKNGSCWYAPTVLTDVTDEMDVVKEETFGPDRHDRSGPRRGGGGAPRERGGVNLTASVWSGSRSQAPIACAQKLKAGTVTINSHGDALGAALGTLGRRRRVGFGRLNGELGLARVQRPRARRAQPRCRR